MVLNDNFLLALVLRYKIMIQSVFKINTADQV